MIKKIIIEINSKEYELTIEEAKAFYNGLKEIFEKEKDILRIPEPYPVYPQPYNPWWNQPIVTFSEQFIRCGFNDKT